MNKKPAQVSFLIALFLLLFSLDSWAGQKESSFVKLTIKLPDETITTYERAGSVLRVKYKDELFGFLPVQVDEKAGVVRLEVYQAVKFEPGETMLKKENTKKIEEIEVPFKGAVTLKSRPMFSVEAALAGRGSGRGHTGSCCVTCGSTTACDCSVSMSCGTCCAGDCCTPGGGGKITLPEFEGVGTPGR